MTTPSNSSNPMSRYEFETRLHELIDEARRREYPLPGAYSDRDPDPEIQDYDIEITEVTNDTGVDGDR